MNKDGLDGIEGFLASDHSAGSACTGLLLLKYGDYECPSCSEAEPVTQHLPRVQEHRRSGEQIGLHGSPSFFLNGKVVDVSFGLEHLEHAVRAALGKD